MSLVRAWYSIGLPARPDSVTVGRRLVRQVLREWNLSVLAPDAELAVCELLSNAVRHAGRELTVRLELDDALLITVGDDDPTLPQPFRLPDPTGPSSGRGLHIVDRVTTAWGTRSLERGKEVWFRLALPIAQPPAALAS